MIPFSTHAGSGAATCLVIAVQEPTAKQLAQTMLAMFLRSDAAGAVAGEHHRMSLEDKMAWLRDALADHIASSDVAEAIRLTRDRLSSTEF